MRLIHNRNIAIINNSSSNNYNNISVSKKINQILEDMCIYGNIIKEEIANDKNKNDGNKEFYEPNELNNIIKNDQDLFALNSFSKSLENCGIETVIEKANITQKNNSDESSTSLQFITNGLIYKKKYSLKFDFGEEKNEILLEKGKEYSNFVEKLRKKLSRDYNINPEEIIITYPEKGSFEVQVIFQIGEFNNLNITEFENKFKNEKEFEELKFLKSIHTDVLMGAYKLTKNHLDARGNRNDGWGENEKRGNKPYYPPKGWIGIGLNVMDKYDNGDNAWIGMINSPNEWCVAYHGVGRGNSSDKVKNITGEIIKDTFHPGFGQLHKSCPDKYHPGKNVGKGVYCTPRIETAQQFLGCSEINGKKYQTVLMVRVKPSCIRNCDKCSDSKNDNYWVVSGTTDEIRPYRILYKEI